ncbi:unnamed protein product [Adineta steineri]|uniref:Uncharacterized protein n=1 Tax=Adineta steineri TaxID=433720 RepID=A0A818HBN8_9BILA|nr:unnamed protein product [Adineta steineri]CAF0799148.1 unnamed protein product [Adineta steineri]CAF3501858.1 unnamed protein product [Adineta steineri]CAF3517208.1 unnamed protein product [Adineta steineri]
MIFRSLFALTLIITLFVHTLNAINPAYLREQHYGELVDNTNNDIDDEHSGLILKRNINEELEGNTNNNDDDYYIIKRNKYPNFHLSPLWLSRRTRTNRFYGKPLWISRPGR